MFRTCLHGIHQTKHIIFMYLALLAISAICTVNVWRSFHIEQFPPNNSCHKIIVVLFHQHNIQTSVIVLLGKGSISILSQCPPVFVNVHDIVCFFKHIILSQLRSPLFVQNHLNNCPEYKGWSHLSSPFTYDTTITSVCYVISTMYDAHARSYCSHPKQHTRPSQGKNIYEE